LFVAALSVAALVAAVAVLPESPSRPPRIDAGGAIMLGAGIAGLLLVLTEGPDWGMGLGSHARQWRHLRGAAPTRALWPP